MATVRIYKVAELLNTTSQEVIALLKRDHGIEVKSASSTIEEVVAREFVSRLARQRGIKVPSNASYADTPTVARGIVKKPGGKAPEPAKPAAPVMPAPRLVKTAKPPAPPVEPGRSPSRRDTGADARTDRRRARAAASAGTGARGGTDRRGSGRSPRTRDDTAARASSARPRAGQCRNRAGGTAGARRAAGPRPQLPMPGRIVPPTLRLRVEDPRTGQAPPAPPRRPVLVRPPQPTAPPPAATGNLSRPAGAVQAPPGRRGRKVHDREARRHRGLRRRWAVHGRFRRNRSDRRRDRGRRFPAIVRPRRDQVDHARPVRVANNRG